MNAKVEVRQTGKSMTRQEEGPGCISRKTQGCQETGSTHEPSRTENAPCSGQRSMVLPTEWSRRSERVGPKSASEFGRMSLGEAWGRGIGGLCADSI